MKKPDRNEMIEETHDLSKWYAGERWVSDSMSVQDAVICNKPKKIDELIEKLTELKEQGFTTYELDLEWSGYEDANIVFEAFKKRKITEDEFNHNMQVYEEYMEDEREERERELIRIEEAKRDAKRKADAEYAKAKAKHGF